MSADATSETPVGYGLRLTLLKWAVAAGMLSGFLLSPKLWLNERTYPLAPVLESWPMVPPPWDGVVFGVLLLLLVGIMAAPRPRWVILAFVALAGLWALGDQTRWQPWFYQYLFMLLIVACGMGWPARFESQEGALNACRLIVASMYFWSGAQKFNASFALSTHGWLLKPVLDFDGWPAVLASEIAGAGWLVPILESGLGVLLLIAPLRPVGIGAALLMHLLILFCLGPWGHNWNTVVWPWNLAMMAFDVILFASTGAAAAWPIVWPRRFPIGWLTTVLFGVMPLFNFFDWWDAYLSAALYSSNTIGGQVHVSDRVRLPIEVIVHLSKRQADETDPDLVRRPYALDFFDWSMDELNVPPYPARRVYRRLARQLALLGDSPADVVLIIDERPDWLTGEHQSRRDPFED